MKKLLAVVLEMAKNAIATITFSRRRVACSVIWLAVVFLGDRVVLGQVVLSGSAMFSGFSQFGYPTGGPLTYTAYTGVDVIPTPTAPDLGGLTNNGATVYDASFLGHANFDGSTFSNSANLSPVTRITDAYSNPNGTLSGYFNAGQGGAGGRTLSNTDTTLVSLGNNGAQRMCLFDASTGHCRSLFNGHIFIPTNKCVTTSFYTCPAGSATAAQDFGSINFSQTDKNTLFSWGTTPDAPTTMTSVCVYSVDTSNGNYSIPTCVADFKFGLPANNASAWAGTTHYNHGDYVTYALTGANMAGGTGVWAALTAYSLGDIVTVGGLSTTCMYKVTQAGTSGTTSPSFLSTGCNGASLTDGTVKWQGTHTIPVFLYQNTGTSGTSGGSFASSGHPDLLSTITDGSNIVWTNSGPAFVPVNSGWTDMGQISRDTTCGGYPSKYGMAISTNTYGDPSIGYSKYNGTQDTGFWAMVYDCTGNTYRTLNTITGIWTNAHCGAGTGYTCRSITTSTVGDLTAITAPPAIQQPQACPATIHAYRINKDGQYAQLTMTVTNIYAACNPLKSTFLIWKNDPTLFDTNNSLQYTYRSMNHSGMGLSHMVAWGNSPFPASIGVFNGIYDLANPSVAPPFSVWFKPLANQGTTQTVPPGCYVTVGGFGGVEKNPDCNVSEVLDSHLSWVGDPGTDNTPVCGTSYNLATLGPAFNAWQNMEACYPTVPTGCDPAVNTGCSSFPPQSMNSPWQFTHTFALGNSLSFDHQFQISQYSQDGNYLFFSTDNGGTLGSTTGSPPVGYSGSGTYYQALAISAVPANPSSLSGFPWKSATAYVTGNTMNPIEGTSGGGAVDDVFQAIAGGTSGPGSSTGGHQPNCGTTSCFANSLPPSISSVAITAASGTGSTATLTSTLTPSLNGFVTVSNMTIPAYNCSNCLVTATSPTLFSYASTATGAATGIAFSSGELICDAASGAFFDPAPPYSSSCTGGVVWQDLGVQDQRGDVFAVKLTAH